MSSDSRSSGDRGPSSNDLRHRLNVSFIYELPEVAGRQGIINGSARVVQFGARLTF